MRFRINGVTLLTIILIGTGLITPVYAEVDVPISKEMRFCSNDFDCELVTINCESCCGSHTQAINKQYFEDYSWNFKQQCSEKPQVWCECVPMKIKAICEKSICMAKIIRVDSNRDKMNLPLSKGILP